MVELIICPACKSKEENFGELRVADYDIVLDENGDISDTKFNDYLDFGFIFCRDCLSYIRWDDERKRFIEANEEEVIAKALSLLGNILSKDLKSEDFDKFKRIMMLEKLKNK